MLIWCYSVTLPFKAFFVKYEHIIEQILNYWNRVLREYQKNAFRYHNQPESISLNQGGYLPVICIVLDFDRVSWCYQPGDIWINFDLSFITLKNTLYMYKKKFSLTKVLSLQSFITTLLVHKGKGCDITWRSDTNINSVPAR